jgi:mannitol/fructose-specific phosphotransferase system IIA component (Ntr-type)
VDLSRYIQKEHIKIGLDAIDEYLKLNEHILNYDAQNDFFDDSEEDIPDLPDLSRGLPVDKNKVLAEMVSLISSTNAVDAANANSAANIVKDEKRLLNVILDRENKTSTGIGHGVAIPHGRTHVVREFIMGLAVCPEGINFDSLDNEPVNLIFIMASPPDNDTLYLKILKNLTILIRNPMFREELMYASDIDQAYYILKNQV